jgi:RNA polymerase sigma-70 factor (sigma-E family)
VDATAEEQFREFYQASWGRLLRIALLLTDDHGQAEDLVQTTMMRVHTHWRRVQRSDVPEAYTRRMLVNQFNSWWRRRRVPELVSGYLPDRSVGDGQAAVDLHDQIWPAVRALPQRMRAVLVLRYFEDLTEKETADILGCSVGAVKSHTNRAIRKLRELVDDSGGQPPPDPPSSGPPTTVGDPRSVVS